MAQNFNKIMVVCVGNICRSPVGERLLRQRLGDAGITVTSAGIGALVGHEADPTATEVAAENGLSLAGHSARQFTGELAADQDLILVLEPGHRRAIGESNPQLMGKVMLFDQWVGARGIADPHRKSKTFHELVYKELVAAADAWAQKLAPSPAANRR